MKGSEQVAKRISERCLICQIARVRRVWVTPPSLGEKQKIVSVTCLTTGHTCWVRAGKEDLRTIIMVLKRIQLERGGLKELVVDSAFYFSTGKFSELCEEHLGASVEPLSVRSPFEGGRFEKLHDLGGRKMRVLLRSKAGRVADLSDEDLDMLLLEVCLLLNTRPTLSYHYDTDGTNRVITPDTLCWGYTRSCGGGFGYAGSAEPFRPPRDVAHVRHEFMEYHWRLLKEKALEAVQSKCPKGKRGFDLAIGAAVLVHAPTNRKLAFPWRIGQVIGMRGDHTVDVIFPGKQQRVTRENKFNLIPVLHDPENDCVDPVEDPMYDCNREVEVRPDRVGMGLRVKLRVRGKRGLHWYQAVVIREFKSGHVQVQWRDGSPDERLWLDFEDWELDDDVDKCETFRPA
ncbi:hypothetical protein FOL47_004653 [Perkinsus chesapeaki]|uniref:Uncharacterized protein n=1 Tax=Perkinsus chesapeaki TaxID=330153 RepID=A0A7J6M1H2_PERCH|nr:hypothetical protein FOL47_004653 [Perkinsus chesapeaki]